jgi:uncharacterized membrane protein YesL
MQEMQQMVGFSAIGILGIGFGIAIILLILGLLEKSNHSKKVHLIRAGGFLIGLMIIITGLMWYFPLATAGTHILVFEDILSLTVISSLGGLVSGVSCFIPIN